MKKEQIKELKSFAELILWICLVGLTLVNCGKDNATELKSVTRESIKKNEEPLRTEAVTSNDNLDRALTSLLVFEGQAQFNRGGHVVIHECESPGAQWIVPVDAEGVFHFSINSSGQIWCFSAAEGKYFDPEGNESDFESTQPLRGSFTLPEDKPSIIKVHITPWSEWESALRGWPRLDHDIPDRGTFQQILGTESFSLYFLLTSRSLKENERKEITSDMIENLYLKVIDRIYQDTGDNYLSSVNFIFVVSMFFDKFSRQMFDTDYEILTRQLESDMNNAIRKVVAEEVYAEEFSVWMNHNKLLNEEMNLKILEGNVESLISDEEDYFKLEVSSNPETKFLSGITTISCFCGGKDIEICELMIACSQRTESCLTEKFISATFSEWEWDTSCVTNGLAIIGCTGIFKNNRFHPRSRDKEVLYPQHVFNQRPEGELEYLKKVSSLKRVNESCTNDHLFLGILEAREIFEPQTNRDNNMNAF